MAATKLSCLNKSGKILRHLNVFFQQFLEMDRLWNKIVNLEIDTGTFHSTTRNGQVDHISGWDNPQR